MSLDQDLTSLVGTGYGHISLLCTLETIRADVIGISTQKEKEREKERREERGREREKRVDV